MKVLQCTVKHTFTLDMEGVEARLVHVDVDAELNSADAWDDLADILRDYLLPGLLEPRADTRTAEELGVKTQVTEEEAAKGLESLFEDAEVQVECPECHKKFKDFHAMRCHFGHMHKEA